MPERFPRSLVIAIATLAVVSLAVSEYLDFAHPNLLARHPINANLLSSIVSFSIATLVVVIGVRWYSRRALRTRVERLARNAARLFPRTSPPMEQMEQVFIQLGLPRSEARPVLDNGYRRATLTAPAEPHPDGPFATAKAIMELLEERNRLMEDHGVGTPLDEEDDLVHALRTFMSENPDPHWSPEPGADRA